MIRITRWVAPFLLLPALAACESPADPPPPEFDTAVATDTASDTTSDTADVDGPPPFEFDPARDLAPGSPRLTRLTQTQLRHALLDLLGDDTPLPAALEPDAPADGILTAGGAVNAVSSRGVELYEEAALNLGAFAVSTPERRARLVDCAPPEVAPATCLGRFVDTFGRRVWRRAITPAEREALVAIGTAASDALGTFEDGLAWTLAAMLQSPNFLYRFESGEDDGVGRRRYTGVEMASRLAFFLWASPPDDALLDAADSGALLTDAGIDSEVTRMLADPKVRRAVRAFFAEWLQLHRLDHLAKDPNVFTHFSPDLGAAAREETLRLAEHLVLGEDADLRDLLLTRTTFLNRRLAAIYNVPAPVLEGFGQTFLPPDGERRGLLGHVSFLASNSHPTSSSATLRGVFLRQTLLCDPVPPPPSDLNTAIPEPTPDAPTLRDRLAVHREDPSCAGCHMLTDVPGLGLELFDGIGRFRRTENGATIDASGRLGPMAFDGPVGLAEAVADSPKFSACAVRKLYTFAVARPVHEDEELQLLALTGAFEGSERRLLALMREVALSPGFRWAGPVVDEFSGGEGEGE